MVSRRSAPPSLCRRPSCRDGRTRYQSPIARRSAAEAAAGIRTGGRGRPGRALEESHRDTVGCAPRLLRRSATLLMFLGLLTVEWVAGRCRVALERAAGLVPWCKTTGQAPWPPGFTATKQQDHRREPRAGKSVRPPRNLNRLHGRSLTTSPVRALTMTGTPCRNNGSWRPTPARARA